MSEAAADIATSSRTRDLAAFVAGLRVEDPGVFTTPWSARITYRRPLGSWPEFVCAESTRDYVGRTIDLPHTDKPDF